MTWLDTLHHPEYYVKTFLKWALLSVIVGMIGDLPCAGHDKKPKPFGFGPFICAVRFE